MVDLSVDGRITLKLILKGQCVVVWDDFNWISLGSKIDLYEHVNETSNFINGVILGGYVRDYPCFTNCCAASFLLSLSYVNKHVTCRVCRGKAERKGNSMKVQVYWTKLNYVTVNLSCSKEMKSYMWDLGFSWQRVWEWVVTPYTLAGEISKHLRNISQILSAYMAQQPKRQPPAKVKRIIRFLKILKDKKWQPSILEISLKWCRVDLSSTWHKDLANETEVNSLWSITASVRSYFCQGHLLPATSLNCTY